MTNVLEVTNFCLTRKILIRKILKSKKVYDFLTSVISSYNLPNKFILQCMNIDSTLTKPGCLIVFSVTTQQ